MAIDFVNREAELRELDGVAKRGGLLVVYGRRRVGKTRLLRQWLEGRTGLYSQSIEAQPDQQLQQVFQDLRSRLQTKLEPKSWAELLEVLSLQQRPWTLCLDEFPYLVAADSTLPSQLQKWLDHALPARCVLILAGSSQRMMHELFLHRAAPLYGRAHKLLHVKPMGFDAFCAACKLTPGRSAFAKFALVGGIPRYWEFVERGQSEVALCEALYFDFAPYMEQEPQRILRDEGVAGRNALAVLEAVGRGAERPSEIAARLGTAQTNLSRLLTLLLDASILQRDLPFGESTRSTKKVLYRIQDPTMRFWFRVFSPHQSRWRTYSLPEKEKLIHDHAASVFEGHCRAQVAGAQRHWEASLAFDLVAPDPRHRGGHVIAEVKWRHVPAAERRTLLRELESRWRRSGLHARLERVRFAVMDEAVLRRRTAVV